MDSETTTLLVRNAAYPPIGPINRPQTLKDLFKGQTAEKFLVGEAIFWQGDPAVQIFDVLEGVLRVCRILPDGRRAIMGFVYPGDILGASFQNSCLLTAEAIISCRVRRVSRAYFLSQVYASSVLRPQLFALLCDEMSHAQEQMLLLGRKSAEERVVSFLLAIHRKCEVDADIELPMSRLDMADYLGLTIETVSRMMTSLCRRGLIRSTGRHRIALSKLSALREIAGGDADEAKALPAGVRRAVWPN